MEIHLPIEKFSISVAFPLSVFAIGILIGNDFPIFLSVFGIFLSVSQDRKFQFPVVFQGLHQRKYVHDKTIIVMDI
jgi:hypothetical protein